MKRVRRFWPSTLAALAALFLAVGGNIAGVFAETPDEFSALRSFSDAARLWGNGPERFIEEAYRLCGGNPDSTCPVADIGGHAKKDL